MNWDSLIYFLLAIMVSLLVAAVFWKSWRPVLVLAFSPLVVSFAFGVFSWFGDRPAYFVYGLPGPSFFNLDKNSRTYLSTLGCVSDGGEKLELLRANLGLSLMCRIFGWPPSTYHGNFPSQEEAETLTNSAPITPFEVFIKGFAIFGDQSLQLNERQTRQMLRGCNSSANVDTDSTSVRCASVGEDCVLIRIINHDPIFETDLIYLIDRAKVWPFAVYVLRGNAHRFPYFAWADEASELPKPPEPEVWPLKVQH
jgi:hypothetical protein